MPQSCNIENHHLFLASWMLQVRLNHFGQKDIPETMAAVLLEYPASALKDWERQVIESLPSKSSADLLSLWYDIRANHVLDAIEKEWNERFPRAEFPSWLYIQECGGYEECVKRLTVSA